MGKFEETENNEKVQGADNATEKSQQVSGFELLNEGHQAIEGTEAQVYRPEAAQEQLLRTSDFARADSEIREEASKVGKLFTPENRAAIAANIPA